VLKTPDFSKLAPYLRNPLVLVGLALLLFYGVYEALIESDIIRPLPAAAGPGVVHALLNYGFATALTVVVLGFGLEFYKTRQSNSLKSLNLRLELRKAANDVQSSLPQLKDLVEHANRSRQAVASATGRLRSGMMEQWRQQIEADKIKVDHLFDSAPVAEERYDSLNPEELESKLVQVHRLQVQIEELRDKYDAAVRSDDEQRKHIREDARARGRTGGSPTALK